MPATAPTPNPSADEPQFLVIGKVLRPHGIRGELRVQILTAHPERFKFLAQVGLTRDIDDNTQAFDDLPHHEVQRGRLHQEYAIVKLADVETRDDAETLRGMYLVVSLADAIPLEEGEYYFHQLIGLQMVLENGEALGIVQDILETGANDVYIVQSPQYGEVLIPAIESVVQQIDLENAQITITPLPGMLPNPSSNADPS